MLSLAFAAYLIAWGAVLLGLSAAAIMLAGLRAGIAALYETGRAGVRFAGTGLALAGVTGAVLLAIL